MNWFQSLALRIIKTGKLPKHVALIMDGNRRYANKEYMEKGEGHSKGYASLIKVCRYSRSLYSSYISYVLFTIGLKNCPRH